MKDAIERGNELVDELLEDESISDLKKEMIWVNKVAKLYLDNPEFLENQAKVRGLYLKSLRKQGFSKKTAELIVYDHFDLLPDVQEGLEDLE